jgi:hypothetical protein
MTDPAATATPTRQSPPTARRTEPEGLVVTQADVNSADIGEAGTSKTVPLLDTAPA